jgi:hypothetical protein
MSAGFCEVEACPSLKYDVRYFRCQTRSSDEIFYGASDINTAAYFAETRRKS